MVHRWRGPVVQPVLISPTFWDELRNVLSLNLNYHGPSTASRQSPGFEPGQIWSLKTDLHMVVSLVATNCHSVLTVLYDNKNGPTTVLYSLDKRHFTRQGPKAPIKAASRDEFSKYQTDMSTYIGRQFPPPAPVPA